MKKHIAIAVMLLIVMSCNSITYEHAKDAGDVSVTFDLNVNSMVSGTLNQTKTTGIGKDDVINNLWIIQFDGTTDNSKIVGTPQYIGQYTPHSFVNLSPCTSSNRILFLANTNNPILFTGVLSSSLSTIMSKYYNIVDQDDILYGGQMSLLSGHIDCVIGPATANIGSCNMSRNYSIVEFNVINNTVSSSSPLILDSLSVYNVPAKVSFWYGSDLSDMYSDGMIEYSNVESEIIGDTTRYSFIMPANRQGIVSNSDETKKNNFAEENAAYVTLSAQTSSGQGMEYTFYLGANLTNDFNICENMHYQYVVELNGAGNPSVDCRVKKLSGLSNCYLTTTNKAVSVKLGKVDQFWGNNGYENVPGYTLGEDKAWTAEVLWADFPLSNISLTKSSGAGVNDYFTCVSSAEGNALIAVKVNGVIVWSYHIWICNEDLESSAVEWNGAIFMNRNLGANTTDYSTANLYYQFGRKDPIPGNQTIYGTQRTFTPKTRPGGQSYETNVPYSVNNPTVFIYDDDDGTWTDFDKYSPNTMSEIIWNDPVSISGTVDWGSYKSIFDPCPAGWKLPYYKNFSSISSAKWNSTQKCMIISSTFKFPVAGYFDAYKRQVVELGEETGYWTCSSSSVYLARMPLIYTYAKMYDHVEDKATGGLVRCIKE